eukprot:Cvel_25355.t1-p1 / transcript=Cvel_25355.t1 / gene=Cvel_25355 / organism=Chromera_velia_CCMP2878 / gene_product=Asparagine--tRNA ligase, putative / transcript_product=Asparagine--tRNA ligase, putative / location=Cvel_scaffold2860:17827-23201(+) / protein_length=432 / sequence_SO=supercontig / SO=protein_coding / is_pseudo=false
MPDLVLKADPNGPARRMIIISFKLAKLTFSEQPKPGSTSASGVEVPELILETGETIKYTSAILRYIGRVVSGSLGGESFLDEAFVDEWLEIVDSKLLPAVLKGDDASGVETVSALLEEALKSRKFLGGELSVADVAAAVLLEGCAGKLSSAGSSWLERVLDHEAFRSTAPASLGGTSGSPSGATSSVAVPAQSVKAPVAEFSSGGRTRLAAVLLAPDGGKSMTGSVVTVCGWSRTIRKQKQFCFVELTDGSCVPNLQCVVDAAMPEFEKLTKCGTGCSFRFKGTLIESPAKGQAVELTVKDPELHSMQIYGNLCILHQTSAFSTRPPHFPPDLCILHQTSAVSTRLLHFHQASAFSTRPLHSPPDLRIFHQTSAFSTRPLHSPQDLCSFHQTSAFSTRPLHSPPDLCILNQTSAFSTRPLHSPPDLCILHQT